MSWQKMSKHEQRARWKNISKEMALRNFECRFHKPKKVLQDLKDSPGRIVDVMYSKIRYIENR